MMCGAKFSQRQWLVAAALLAAALLGLGILRPGALGIASAALFSAVGVWARSTRRTAPPPLLQILERQPLGKDTGVALVDVGGTPFVVAYGPSAFRFQRLEPSAASEVSTHG